MCWGAPWQPAKETPGCGRRHDHAAAGEAAQAACMQLPHALHASCMPCPAILTSGLLKPRPPKPKPPPPNPMPPRPGRSSSSSSRRSSGSTDEALKLSRSTGADTYSMTMSSSPSSVYKQSRRRSSALGHGVLWCPAKRNTQKGPLTSGARVAAVLDAFSCCSCLHIKMHALQH